MKVLVLGAGKMVGAILEGLKNEVDLSQFYLYSPSGKSAKDLAQAVGANFAASLDEVADPNFVIIGCKPQQLSELAPLIQGKFTESTFISMLAALPEAVQLKILGASKLIRIMPNLPVRFKKGITLLSTASAQKDIKQIQTLFSHVGMAREVSEMELEELTLLTGSGPALFYEFSKTLSESFGSLNSLEREEFARMVLLGSAISAEKSDEPLQTMIDNVTSKGGVTIAILQKWRELNFGHLISQGVKNGKQRAQEIKKTLL